MDSRQRTREESRERVKAAEERLQRLREIIERRARLGFDTSEGWRLFGLTATLLANMRHTDVLLDALQGTGERWASAGARSSLAPGGAERVAFPPGATIQGDLAETSNCYLIESGIVSLCFGSPGGVEVGMVGPGGVVGLSALLTAELMPVTAVAITRCRAVPIPLEELADRITSDVKGLRFLHTTVAQQWADTVVLARCNAEHSVRERLSRWILTGTRHLGDEIGPISHDRLASLLGVRRASITVALHEIESEGAIHSRRNLIEMRDESALERLSCGCHIHLLSQTTDAVVSDAPRALPSTH